MKGIWLLIIALLLLLASVLVSKVPSSPARQSLVVVLLRPAGTIFLIIGLIRMNAERKSRD